ncbi:MAG: universal stress protein [bacterium]
MKFKHILVPVDFSDFSDKAAEYALFLAEQFCARVTLLHVMILFKTDVKEKEHLESYEEFVQGIEEEYVKQLKENCENGKKRGVKVDSILKRGISEADAILDHSINGDYDLIVMGTHGRTGIKRWMAGSVTEKVVHHSPLPVVTVHKDIKKFSIQNILIPDDFSGFSKKAVEQGKSLAEDFKARCTFLHSVMQREHEMYYNISSKSILEANPQLGETIKDNLAERTGIKQDKADYVVLEGKPFKTIVQYAGENEIDLIVMATRGLGALAHMLMGSNAERVVRISPCPVLTVRKSD